MANNVTVIKAGAGVQRSVLSNYTPTKHIMDNESIMIMISLLDTVNPIILAVPLFWGAGRPFSLR